MRSLQLSESRRRAAATGAFENSLQHVSDEMQILWMASKIDAVEPTAGPEVRQCPIEISLRCISVFIFSGAFG